MTEPRLGILADVEIQLKTQSFSKASGLLISDVFLIVAAALTLLLLLLLWARYFRNLKFNKPRSGGHKVYRDSAAAQEERLQAEAQAEAQAAEARRRYKYRYRRRDHRSRNPTLAETGGLPPERVD